MFEDLIKLREKLEKEREELIKQKQEEYLEVHFPYFEISESNQYQKDELFQYDETEKIFEEMEVMIKSFLMNEYADHDTDSDYSIEKIIVACGFNLMIKKSCVDRIERAKRSNGEFNKIVSDNLTINDVLPIAPIKLYVDLYKKVVKIEDDDEDEEILEVKNKDGSNDVYYDAGQFGLFKGLSKIKYVNYDRFIKILKENGYTIGLGSPDLEERVEVNSFEELFNEFVKNPNGFCALSIYADLTKTNKKGIGSM